MAAAKIHDILESACAWGADRLSLTTATGQIFVAAGRQPADSTYGRQHDDVRINAPVVVHGSSVATVCVAGAAAQQAVLEKIARMAAMCLADAWTAAQATQEIDSLAGEIVHAYEELHLLYELGDALIGQATVAQVANLILEKMLQTLPAEWAELSLTDADAPLHVRLGHQADTARVRRSEQQRLSTTLRSGGQTLGALALVRARTAKPFTSGDAKLLDAVGTFAGSAIRNAQLCQEVDTDALTGLASHRAIQERLDAELAGASKQGHTLGILMIDIDDFKLFNDTYGHLVGDQILRMTGEVLQQTCRDNNDAVGRYGGDEFLVLLPRTSQNGISMVAQRIFEAMAQRGVNIAGQDPLPVALSIGCALFPQDAVLKHDLLSHANAALYETKHHGGNSMQFAGEAMLDTHRNLSSDTTFGALHGLVNAVDAKDRYTREHSDVVTIGALALGEYVGLPEDECEALRIAGLLHDVGKIGIPDHILRKPGRLTEDEYKIMQQHVALSELIIKDVPHLEHVLSAVACHHERYDGRGYPRGLKGEEIPVTGRIMALADACSAMLLSRPYRKGMSWTEVATELRKGSGTQFDPKLVEPFISAMESSPYLARAIADT